jgi:hypothetical protein
MVKLVNFIKINFILIIVSFFLPFVPSFCEKKAEVSSADSTLAIVETPVENHDTLSTGSESLIDTLSTNSNESNSEARKDIVMDAGERKSSMTDFIEYLSISQYSNNRSITGFGLIVAYSETIFEGELEISELLCYAIPLSILSCILGLIFSIKSRKRKPILILISSCVGLISIVTFGLAVGNIIDLLFGFWIAAVLYLINTLLSFILWKNYPQGK